MFQQTIGNIRLLLWLLISTSEDSPKELFLITNQGPVLTVGQPQIICLLYLSNSFFIKNHTGAG